MCIFDRHVVSEINDRVEVFVTVLHCFFFFFFFFFFEAK